jgi:RNA polymerase sigma-70 factor (ECF subfamily)
MNGASVVHTRDMSNPASDADLIALAWGGDDRAFAVLVGRYEGAVAATVIGMLGRGDDADDVGQETFIRFHRALGNFRGESSLRHISSTSR